MSFVRNHELLGSTRYIKNGHTFASLIFYGKCRTDYASWGMPSVWNFISDRISLTLTLKDLGLREFCIELNILPSIPAWFMSFRKPCLYVESFVFSMSKKMGTTCSLFAWAFLTVVSRDKRWWIVVQLALPPHCNIDSVLLWSKTSNSLTFTIISITLHRTIVSAIGL